MVPEFLRRLVQPPQMRLGNDRRASWLELFYDLAFVVAVSTVGHELSNHLNWFGIIQFVVFFSLLWWGWSGYTFYYDRFGTDDLSDRLMTLLHMVTICLMAAFAHGWLTDSFYWFMEE